MRVYLVRHGEAVSDSNDTRRPLSRQGIDEVTKVARFLKESQAHVESIYHSTKLRALQTAEIFRNTLEIKTNLVEREGLSPNDAVHKTADFIDQQKNDLMIVGHMPFMGSLVSLLLTGDDNRNLLSFSTGSVAILEKERGKWAISGFVNPSVL